jgi:hypothetical protein
MFKLRLLGVGLLALAGGMVFVGCGSDDKGGTSGQSVAELCAKGCEKTDSLNCANDPPDCAATCAADAKQIPAACDAKLRALLSCFVGRPTSDFECDSDGESAPKDGICDSEAMAAGTCLAANGGGGPPGDECVFALDGECDEPDGCDVGTDTTDCSP